MTVAIQPTSIKLFERAYFASLLLSIAQFALFHRFDPDMAEVGDGPLVAIALFVALLALAIWYFIARRASNFWRWLFSALVLLSLVAGAVEVETTISRGWFVIAFELATLLLDIVSAWLLFTPEARRWFANKGKFGDVDPDIFG
jgi:cell division protein FtsW (lipid II flippase)